MKAHRETKPVRPDRGVAGEMAELGDSLRELNEELSALLETKQYHAMSEEQQAAAGEVILGASFLLDRAVAALQSKPLDRWLLRLHR